MMRSQANQHTSFFLTYTILLGLDTLLHMKSMKSMKFAERTPQVQKLIRHVDFLHKANFEQRKTIQELAATKERQKVIIKYLKAELKEVKAKKAMKAMKSMKAK